MPGLDHEVHEKTRIGADYRHGCWNKPRPADGSGYFAPDRHHFPNGSFVQVTRWIPFTMSRECRSDMSLADPACDGCQWRGSGERYSEEIRAKGT